MLGLTYVYKGIKVYKYNKKESSKDLFFFQILK